MASFTVFDDAIVPDGGGIPKTTLEAIKDISQHIIRELTFRIRQTGNYARDNNRFFLVDGEVKNGRITITPKPYPDLVKNGAVKEKRIIAEFFSEIRMATDCLTWTDMVAGKRKTGAGIGSFRSSYNWLGSGHYGSANNCSDLAAGFSRALLHSPITKSFASEVQL